MSRRLLISRRNGSIKITDLVIVFEKHEKILVLQEGMISFFENREKKKIDKETKKKSKGSREVTVISSDSDKDLRKKRHSKDKSEKRKKERVNRTVTISGKNKSPKVVYNPLTGKAEANVRSNREPSPVKSEDEGPKVNFY